MDTKITVESVTSVKYMKLNLNPDQPDTGLSRNPDYLISNYSVCMLTFYPIPLPPLNSQLLYYFGLETLCTVRIIGDQLHIKYWLSFDLVEFLRIQLLDTTQFERATAYFCGILRLNSFLLLQPSLLSFFQHSFFLSLLIFPLMRWG